MLDFVCIHMLSISRGKITTATFNELGNWLTFGCAKLGQLLVWEWKSESYILKQQGHYFDVDTIPYSSNSQLLAIGADDNKIKIFVWSMKTGRLLDVAYAAFVVLNFSENCAPDILTPYLDEIVSKLLVQLQEQFQKYYDAVMPYLKAILVNLKDKAKRMLRAKAMKCSSLVGMVVGADKFIDDAKQVMEVFISLQGAQMKTNDPTTSYMLQLGVISKRARQKSYVFPFPNSVRVCCCRHGPGYVSVWVRISFRICSCCASFASVCSTET